MTQAPKCCLELCLLTSHTIVITPHSSSIIYSTILTVFSNIYTAHQNYTIIKKLPLGTALKNDIYDNFLIVSSVISSKFIIS